MKRIAIIAGEASGDLLAARLIRELKAQYPDCEFEGIAGQEMQAAGCVSLFPMEQLSVMGIVEVLKHLRTLLAIRKQLYQRWQHFPPDLFIGVDAPDFNLPLAKKLHALGIPTAHYVSPSIWAWREKRVRKMQGNLDLMLCLFPFEAAFYEKHGVPATFVGHPLADEITFNAPKQAARNQLQLMENKPVLAILVGSRMGEVKRLAADFFQAALLFKQTYPDVQIISPTVNAQLKHALLDIHAKVTPALDIVWVDGQSRTVMQAADLMLVASGTAVLEGMLTGRLMVAGYRVAAFTMWLLRTFKLLKVKYVTLPNNLANEALVPEVLQEAVTPIQLFDALNAQYQLPPEQKDHVLTRFAALHDTLRQQASVTAARTLIQRFF